MMEEISWKQILGLENSHKRFIFIGNLFVDGKDYVCPQRNESNIEKGGFKAYVYPYCKTSFCSRIHNGNSVWSMDI
jgi:hypothetical protein